MHTFFIANHIGPETQYAFNYFLKSLKEREDDKDIRIYINSGGGLTQVMLHIVNHLIRLKKKGYHIQTIGQDKVFSSALVIFVAGTERLLSYGTEVMFHRSKGRIKIETELTEDTVLMQELKVNRFKEENEKIIEENKFILNLFNKETKVDRNTFFKLENEQLDIEKAIKLNIATGTLKTLDTYYEKKYFADKFVEDGNFLFSIEKEKEEKLKEHYHNYQIGLISRNELVNLVIDLL